MNIEDLEALCAVEECGSYFGAAARLYLSPNVISKRISRLERELGLKLVMRATKSSEAELTEDGLAVIEDARELTRRARRIRDYAGESGREGRALTIGFSRRFGYIGEMEIFSRFSIEYPGTELRMRTAETEELAGLLRRGAADGALISAFGRPRVEEALRLFEGEPEFCVEFVRSNPSLYIGFPESHPLAGLERITREHFPALAKETFIFKREFKGVVDYRGSVPARHMMELLGAAEPPKARFADFSAPSLSFDLVRAGAGLISLPGLPPRSSTGIRFVPVEGENVANALFFAYRKASRSKDTACFLRCVREERDAHAAESDKAKRGAWDGGIR